MAWFPRRRSVILKTFLQDGASGKIRLLGHFGHQFKLALCFRAGLWGSAPKYPNEIDHGVNVFN